MIPEVGHFALILALCMALVQTIVPMAGTFTGVRNWVAVAQPAAWAQTTFLVIAFTALTHSFLNNDFSVAYVANHSNTALPTMYKISAVWGAHEGSLLLWSLILGIWTVAVSIFSRRLPSELLARVLSVMGFVSIGFILFMLFTSNPFERMFPMPLEGRDLNPLLQDPGLAIHPPMLYMGYVGFSVAFSFAIGALIGGKLDSTWSRWSRPWTTIAWAFLTIGIALGSWWAYNELGWGGWWFWDPVENASFIPWLVGTALVHSLAVSEKRGAFKRWTVLLAIAAFSLSLLGTFLVRSGVLTSVHAFATDPARGVFILGFLAVVIGGSLLLYAVRAPSISSGGQFGLFSRETLLLGNNVILVVVAGTVLLGTLYPLFIDALGMGKISVGFPYFNSVFIPLMTPLAILMGIGPLVGWKQGNAAELFRILRWAAIASLVVAGLFALPLFGPGSLLVGLGSGVAFWITAATFAQLYKRVSARASIWEGLRAQSRSYYGMIVAHLGIAVTTVGITFVSNYGIETDLRMAPGENTTLAGYTFEFDGVAKQQGANYVADRGSIMVSTKGKEVAHLWPEKRTYRVQTMAMTEAAIDVGFTRDLYVSLGEPLGDGAWSVRIYYKPFVRWIWLGAILMALGGLLAVVDRRYRVRTPARRAEKTTPDDVVSEGRV
ncbi:MAG: heme lyase CcmF/NrfE family subunit [Gammaproteobacteria bacterium]